MPARTLQNWCLGKKDLISLLREQARALMDERCDALLPEIFDKIETATRDGDARSVDMYSRAVVNLTRGVVREQVEIAHTSPETPDELAALLSRHGVQFEQRSERG